MWEFSCSPAFWWWSSASSTSPAPAFLGAKYRLVTYLPEVDGLTVGAPVDLDGVEIGNVDADPHGPVQAGQTARRRSATWKWSCGSAAIFRTTSAAIQRQLDHAGFRGRPRSSPLQRGYTGAVLQDGQEVPGERGEAIQRVVERGADLMQNLNTLSTQINGIVGDIHAGPRDARQAARRTKASTTTWTPHRPPWIRCRVHPAGTGNDRQADRLRRRSTPRLNSVTGHVDNVLAAVEDQKGTLGKLVYDPSFHDDAKNFLDNSNALALRRSRRAGHAR